MAESIIIGTNPSIHAVNPRGEAGDIRLYIQTEDGDFVYNLVTQAELTNENLQLPNQSKDKLAVIDKNIPLNSLYYLVMRSKTGGPLNARMWKDIRLIEKASNTPSSSTSSPSPTPPQKKDNNKMISILLWIVVIGVLVIAIAKKRKS